LTHTALIQISRALAALYLWAAYFSPLGRSSCASCLRRSRRVEMMPSLTDSQTRSSSVARRPMAPIGLSVGLQMAECIAQCLNLEHEPPPPCLGAVHSLLRATRRDWPFHSSPLGFLRQCALFATVVAHVMRGTT